MTICNEDHPALALLRDPPDGFDRHGAVVATWRNYRGRRLGPYFRLAWREHRRQRSIYLGREGPLVQHVRSRLGWIQRDRSWRRDIARQRRELLRPLRQFMAESVRLYAPGFYFKGWELRGFGRRGAPIRTICPPNAPSGENLLASFLAAARAGRSGKNVRPASTATPSQPSPVSAASAAATPAGNRSLPARDAEPLRPLPTRFVRRPSFLHPFVLAMSLPPAKPIEQDTPPETPYLEKCPFVAQKQPQGLTLPFAGRPPPSSCGSFLSRSRGCLVPKAGLAPLAQPLRSIMRSGSLIA